MSDSDDGIDVAAHGKLISSIQSLDGKKKQKNVIRGIPVAPNNLHLVVQSSRDSSQITAADIKFKEKGDKVLLAKPKSSGELEKAQRQIARETMVKDTSQWDPLVRNMRLAPQINYVKHNESISIKGKPKAWGFVPTTPLEKELFAALGKSEDVLRPNKEFTAAEEKALKAMSIKEARMRRNELMKHQELLTRAGVKAKRLKKIKSKKYRKILKKEKLASDRKELEQLHKTDPEAFVERMEQLDRDRMEERLTLKHKGGGKFSRLHKAYSKFDDKTRSAVQDMLQKSKELTKKRQDSTGSEEEEMEDEQTKATAGDEGSDEEDIGTSEPTSISITKPKSITKLAGGWLDGPTKYVYNSKEKDVQESLNQEDVAKENQDASKHASEVEGVEDKIQDEEDVEDLKFTEEEENVNSKKRKKRKSSGDEGCEKTTESADETKDDGDKDEEPAKKKRKKRKRKRKNKNSEQLKEENDPKPVKETILQSVEEKGEEREEVEDEEDNMKVSMEELFQDEDFLEEFAKDTSELEAKMRPKVSDTKLPGWGSWAGPDYKEIQKKIAEAKAKKGQPVKKGPIKKDPAVWLNPNRNDNIRKYQPKSVPFPYQSVNQYEASLRQPVSRGLVRETAHKMLTKPEIVTKLGHIIQPLDKGLLAKKQTQFEMT